MPRKMLNGYVVQPALVEEFIATRYRKSFNFLLSIERLKLSC
jgi:hypothetical protein